MALDKLIRELFCLRQSDKDVVFLQETHSDAINAVDWVREIDGLSFMSHNTSNSSVVAILFSRTITPLSNQVEGILEGRLLQVNAQFKVFIYFLSLCT